MTNNSKYLFFLFLGVFILVISPTLLSVGMFMDGIIYASIAENLSNGIGSTWAMQFTGTSGPFNGHPPMAMYLESFFFKLFGSAIWVEKIYSVLTIIITSIISTIIFRKLYSSDKNSYPIVLFFMLTMPLIYWISINNLLENTLAIFSTLSIYFLIQHERNFIANMLIGGVFIYLAFLTKGIVALFPFAVPFWLVVFRYIEFKKFLFALTFTVFGFSLVAICVHFIEPESTEFFRKYFQEQVVNSIQQVSTVNSRYQIIIDYLAEIAIGFTIIGWMIFYTKTKVNQDKLKRASFFVAISLSGVIPMMISMKQSGFYIYPILPITAIAMAILAEPYFVKYLEKIYAFNYLKHLSFSVLILAIAFSLFFKNSIHRDKELIEDVNKISQLLGDKTFVNIGLEINMDYSTHCYFYRLHKKSMAVYTGDSLRMVRATDVADKLIVYKGHHYALIKE
ncbi:MAG: ArnT family glycosyltransferase [Bacteroidia bacterium]